MPTTEVRKIIVKSDISGSKDLKKVARNLGGINKNVKKTAQSFSLLKNAFIGFVSAIGLRELTRAVDEFQLLEDRITSLTGSTQMASQTFDDLAIAAKITKSSIAGLAEVYNRVSLAVSDLGVSSEAILGTTLALQQTFRLSGSTLAEATGATIQLTQGLSAGALRGQELRSVLESNAILSGLLAEKFGVARGQLIKLAETGAITSKKVFEVLADNFVDLNTKADTLRQTFEQSLIIAFDQLKLRLRDLNKEFDLSGKFAKGIEFLVNNFDDLAKGIGVFAGVLGGASIVSKIISIAKGLGLLGSAVLALAAGAAYLAATWETSSRQIIIWWKQVELTILTGLKSVQETFEAAPNFIRKALGFDDAPKKKNPYVESLTSDIGKLEAEISTLEKEIISINKKSFKFGDTKLFIEKLKKALEEAVKKMDGFNKKIKITNQGISDLNVALDMGTISLSEYQEGISGVRIDKLNEDLAKGAITIGEYNKKMAETNTLLSFTESTSLGVKNGLDTYAKSVGTLAEGISGMVNNTFKSLEDKMVEFAKTGKASFKDLANSIIEDMLRIAIQQNITGGLAKGLGGLFSGTPQVGGPPQTLPAYQNTQGVLPSAKGNAFDSGNLQAFASGGIVSSPTFFGFGGGKVGVAGEAGSEAILPLKRGLSGNLGVETSGMGGSNVQVNVINQTADSETSTVERTDENGARVIDILIKGKVKEALSDGTMDRTFKSRYGLNPRGS